MSVINQNFIKPFSRLKNGLIELQAFYPAYIRNDGVGGLTVDPILYRTNFGPNTIADEGGLMDEANTAGIRVEVVGDAGETINHNFQTNIRSYVNPNNSEPRTIFVNDTTGFSASGTFVINGITVTYTGLTATTFTGCTGVNSTTAPNGINIPSQCRQGTTGTYTLTISGSGTYSPKCKITYGNLIFEWYLIAPSAEQSTTSSTNTTWYAPATAAHHKMVEAGVPQEPLNHFGPYPVFMTVQECAEMIDTYRHVGGQDETKRSFLPHGTMNGGTSSNSRRLAPFIGSNFPEPRPTDSTDIMRSGIYGRSTNSIYAQRLCLRSSVFMPMMLDNNQMGMRSDPQTSFSWPFATHLDSNFIGYKKQGIERYDHDPIVQGSSNGFFKTVGWSGDHQQGAVGSFGQCTSTNYFGTSVAKTVGGALGFNYGYQNPDVSMDSTAAVGPKYRMRMALACFLKDGTYTINDGGNMIPYIYDSERTIGGKNTNTLYAVWNGKDGYGKIGDNGSDYRDDCSAQIFPMFDFVQGPLSPAKQGNNFDSEVLEGLHSVWGWVYDQESQGGNSGSANVFNNPRAMMVKPNPTRVKIEYVEKTTLGLFKIYTLGLNSSGKRFSGGFGAMIYIDNVDGQFGSAATNKDVRFDARNTAGWQTGIANTLDYNGWWISRGTSGQSFGNLGSGNAWTQTTTVQCQTGLNQTGDLGGATFLRYKVASDAYMCQGRPSGYEAEQTKFLLANQSGRKWVWPLGRGGPAGLSTGFSAGVCMPDSNSPAGGSEDSTYPARPTIFDFNIPNDQGKYGTSTKPTKRSMGIRRGGDDEFLSSPTVSVIGDGVLRIPPPIGWDLARYYYSQSVFALNAGTDEKPDFKREVGDGGQVGMNSRWAFRGIHIPLWSAIDPITGNHAFDYVKPSNYKAGTASYIGTPPVTSETPNTFDSRWNFGRNRIWPPHERIGTRAAYSPSLLENVANNAGANGVIPADGGWGETATGNYLAANTESTKYGATEMGCSPVWLDMEMRANIPIKKDRLVILEFDNGIQWGPAGRHAMITSGGTRNYQFGQGFYPVWDGDGDVIHPNAASGTQIFGSDTDNMRNPTYTANRPSVWFWGGSDLFTAAWTNTDATVFPRQPTSGNNGWGNMGNGYGFGTPQNVVEGYQTIRTVFTEGGMTYILNGKEIGTDPTAGSQIWGMTIKVGDAMGFLLEGQINNSAGDGVFTTKPSLQMSQQDLQIDEIVLRQIPTPAMVPYTVDSVVQNITDVGRMNSLTIEADNIDLTRGMNVTITIMKPNTKIDVWSDNPTVISYDEYRGIEQGSTTIVTDTDGALMENMDLDFIAGMGSIDLTKLPTASLTDGIVIRFNIIIPNSTQTQFHPIDWNAVPIIRNWSLDFTVKPTITTSVIGNTDSGGDLTPPIDTSVGNVVSFRSVSETTDTSRTITNVKFDFGDGIETGWMDLLDKTTQSQTFDVAHVYTKAGTFAMLAYSRDDAGNISETATAISIVVAETKPVSILRAAPSLIRANNTITLDASSSYIVSSDPARTIASFTFDPKDGSSPVTQVGSTLVHTYTVVGEYAPQVTCTDNASPSNTSDVAKVIVKVLASSATPVDLLSNLNTRPRSFQQSRSANMAVTPTLDGTFPEITDTGQRSNNFDLKGSFLKATATADILTMEGYLANGTLLEIEWQTTDFAGGSSVQKFTGRMISFDYEREGGKYGETPYVANFLREE